MSTALNQQLRNNKIKYQSIKEVNQKIENKKITEKIKREKRQKIIYQINTRTNNYSNYNKSKLQTEFKKELNNKNNKYKKIETRNKQTNNNINKRLESIKIKKKETLISKFNKFIKIIITKF